MNRSLSLSVRSVIPTRDNPPPELFDWLNQFKQWSHVERLVAVDRLIEHCEPTQVRHMMKVIEPQFQRDFISLLPEELALQVLSYLPPKDLMRAAQTCKSWRSLCDDNLLWKEKCRQLNITIDASANRTKRTYGRPPSLPPFRMRLWSRLRTAFTHRLHFHLILQLAICRQRRRRGRRPTCARKSSSSTGDRGRYANRKFSRAMTTM